MPPSIFHQQMSFQVALFVACWCPILQVVMVRFHRGGNHSSARNPSDSLPKKFCSKTRSNHKKFHSYHKDFSSSEPASLLATQCFGHLSPTSPPHVYVSCWPEEALRWDSSCQPLRTPRPDSLCSLIINLKGGCESIGPTGCFLIFSNSETQG